jgi:O-antigen/teichoic acid export membrane protein
MAGNAAWRLAATVARVGIGVVSVSLFTRMLGMSQWGLLALFQAAVAPLALLDGLGTATVKFVAEALGRGDREDATRVVHTTLLFNLAVGGAGALGLLLSSRWLATAVFAIPAHDVGTAIVGFRLMAGLWFITVITATYSGVLSAHQRYDQTSQLATLSVFGSTALGLVAAALTRSVVAVVVAQAVAGALMAVLYFRRASRLLPGIAAIPRGDRATFRRSLSFGVWQVVGMVGSLMTGWGDRYILGGFFAPAIVGFYAVASLLHTQLYAAFMEIGEVLFPAVSHLEGRGELADARRLSLLMGWTLTTGFGVCATVLAIVGGDFLRLWISAEAALATTGTLRVLCVAGIVAMTAIAPLFYLLGIGKTRWDAASGLVNGAAVIGVGLLVVPRHGLAGVGYGLLAASLIRWIFVALIWRVHFRPQYGIGDFAAHVWSPPLVSIATLLVLSRWHDALARPVGWAWLVVETVVAFGLALAIQLGISELVPGGGQRRRDVVASFKPMLAKAAGMF